MMHSGMKYLLDAAGGVFCAVAFRDIGEGPIPAGVV
jgi:hypothetical protein